MGDPWQRIAPYVDRLRPYTRRLAPLGRAWSAGRRFYRNSPLTRYLLRRFGQSLIVLWVAVTLTFVLVKSSPGDPFAGERNVPEHVRERLEEAYGLDRPPLEQYFHYLGNLLQGDLGPSYRETRTVNEILADHLPVSLELGAWSLLVAVCLGVPAGTLAALRSNSPTDYATMGAAMVGLCLPTFVIGPSLALIFGVWLGWLPVTGWFEPASRILPAISLGLVYAAILARVTRGGMLEVLRQNYLTTARAKGLPPWTILWKHTLRGGLLPTVSVLGPVLAGILSGSFVIETVFQIPGMGRYFVQSVFNRDYLLILGTVILYSSLITAANLTVDIVIGLLDPRVRTK
ncbi:MAG: ABC transporter permease [Opitutales bacterium]